MIFCHIVDDFYLQGWLASAKQKSWWEANAPRRLYKHDYIVALAIHSLSWSFMILLPIAFSLSFDVNWFFLVIFILNAILHGLVDDLKANKLLINLMLDQSIHIFQIVVTFIFFVRIK
jgi:hypothetical protein